VINTVKSAVIAFQSLALNRWLAKDASNLAIRLPEQFTPAENLTLPLASFMPVSEADQSSAIEYPVHQDFRHHVNSLSDVDFHKSAAASDSFSHSNLLLLVTSVVYHHKK
jgi:hypothetical protein